MTTLSLKMDATYEALEALPQFIRTSASPIDSTVLAQILLAVHELCINIIEHAYKEAEGDIVIDANRQPQWVEYRIRDHAPNAYIEPEHILSPDPLSLPEGGWGVYILHQVMRTVEYRRFSDGNEWHLVKDLPSVEEVE